MTAEIAVMNCEAVALAADSAVTLDFSSGPKVFSSANKIFALSASEPVGIMVFGGASFVGMPWETIIKEFRSTLKGEALSKISDYADRFLADLLAHKPFAGADAQRQSFIELIHEAYSEVLEAFTEAATRELEHKSTLSEGEVRELLAERVTASYEAWKGGSPLPDLPANFGAMIRRRYTKQIRDLRRLVFEDLPMSASTSRKLGEIAGLVFTHAVPLGVDLPYSGVVISGFGKDEYFPRFVRMRIYGVAGDFIRLEAREEIRIEQDNRAVIAPFAQREMVDAFIEGLEPSYGASARIANIRLADELVDIALERAALGAEEREEIRRVVRREIRSKFQKLDEELYEIRFDRNVRPIIEVVAALPKDELAAMAESLVNLTSFKRRVSRSPETVGGPIDVAVISRGDGFVWIRRKHYFPSELNPRYLANLSGGSS